MSRLRHPRNDSIVVSLAGPATNVVLVACRLAFRYAAAHRLFVSSPTPSATRSCSWSALANLTLGFFNLLPLPPLDGSVLVERSSRRASAALPPAPPLGGSACSSRFLRVSATRYVADPPVQRFELHPVVRPVSVLSGLLSAALAAAAPTWRGLAVRR